MLGDLPVAVLLMLDAGLRLGEVWGLRWGAIWWGGSATDTKRSIHVTEAKARGIHDGDPKSGRSRRIAMSRRLRSVLRKRWMELGKPGDRATVIVSKDMKRWQSGPWTRLCELAEVGDANPKDLRDSFASYLLTAGIQLG